MKFLEMLNMENLTGLSSGLLITILAAVVVVLIVLVIVTLVRMRNLRERYDEFMEGKNGQSLENVLLDRIQQMEALSASEEENKKQISIMMEHFNHTFQKVGMVKYNAFNEMGGKLSFSLALLNRNNDGFIINAMHSREGCFTYVKEIVAGKSVIMLSEEEGEALQMALNDTYTVGE
ncbi:MAG: DUF4446 family protein [Clostridiales bacterium]|nr:DUF4446 family protein [Clostridiales bacterium]